MSPDPARPGEGNFTDDPLLTPAEHQTREQVRELKVRSAELIRRAAAVTRSKALMSRFQSPPWQQWN